MSSTLLRGALDPNSRVGSVARLEVPIHQWVLEDGLGNVYTSRLPLIEVYKLLALGSLLYSPRYQRGFLPRLGDSPDLNQWFDELLPITNEHLLISESRCNEIAVRWLKKDMTNRDLVWNARIGGNFTKPYVDREKSSLRIFGPVTLPDSGHRHKGIYTAVDWKLHPNRIPKQVKVDRTTIGHQELRDLLEQFDPDAIEVNIKIYEVAAEVEGKIFYQANNLTKAAAPGVGIDLNRGQTPESRFVYTLMERSPIFAEKEVERRFTKIGEKSRKVTTISTLVEAVSVFNKRLQYLEQHDEQRYSDLVDFVTTFFEEYSQHFPAWQPDANTADRQAFRKVSYAMTNVLVHALFRLVFRLYEDMERESRDWRHDVNWRAIVAKLARKIEIMDDDGTTMKVSALDKDNPAWQGKILVQGLDRKTKTMTWGISNTRQTRQAAYDYLCELVGL